MIRHPASAIGAATRNTSWSELPTAFAIPCWIAGASRWIRSACLDPGGGDAARHATVQLEVQPMAQARSEHRSVDRDADRAPKRAEQVRGRGRGADLTRRDGVLDRDHQDLGDHPEADPEPDHDQRRGHSRAGGTERREQE